MCCKFKMCVAKGRALSISKNTFLPHLQKVWFQIMHIPQSRAQSEYLALAAEQYIKNKLFSSSHLSWICVCIRSKV
ncbi:hypothetical protein CAAN1_42S00122 [[Candida] anglica]|uniref:Uncharacterized protein n=1 Tax=[Candida] anglica TaxID=148631 RepID=A0ABP0EHL6_9ASCO